ncbi:MAG TPA: MerR family transcriptional regulator [Blastocatellia bacterium]|jgi:DNA-binding transcriptional MerR regulator
MTQRWYQASEFAELAGVTVRALHHYDRLRLLRPSGRTAAGYRLYGEGDFARLQQIVTLKFIGFSLKQIKELLDRGSFDLSAALRLQREIIKEKRRHLDLAIQAIEKAERVMSSGGEPDWEAFKKVIEVINMQKDMDWMNKYYSEEAQQKLAQTPREVVEQGQQDWATLIKEAEAAVAQGEDPASEKAQALAVRWSNLIKAFTGGNPEISEGLSKLYADQANWPSTFQKPYSDEVGAFMCEAVAILNKK